MSSGAARVRVAAVGLGWVTLNRHIPTLKAVPGYELIGVIDSHQGRALDVASRLGLQRHAQTSSLADVDWLDEIDAVTIGVPPMGHHALTMDALRRGKHVLTEKPFAMTVEEGEAMSQASLESGRALCVVHNFQFSRSYLRLRQDLEAGMLGQIRHVYAQQLSNPGRRLPKWYEALPGGLFFDESPHLLYLVSDLLPDATLHWSRITPSSSGLNTPARVISEFTQAIGAGATVIMDFEAAVSEWHLVVVGSSATADVDLFRDIYIRVPDDGEHVAAKILRTSGAALGQHLAGTVRSGLRFLTGNLRYGNDEVFRRFAESIRAGSSPKAIGADSALRVLSLQHEILANG